jgi:hypothetical protein
MGRDPLTAGPILSMQFYQFRRSAKALGRKEGREADIGRSVLCRPISVLRLSDIVKRKRIRSRAGWGEAPQASREGYGLRSGVLSFIRPFEQPVVGLEPDRSDPRMRLKQNWSFQRQGRSEMDNRTTDIRRTQVLWFLLVRSSVLFRNALWR